MQKMQERLGEILLGRGLINSGQLEEALKEQSRTGEFLGTVLIKKKFVREKELLEALSRQYNIPVVGLKDKYIDWNVVKEFHPSLILGHRCLPLEKNERSVTMAITNPLDAWAMKQAEMAAGGLELRLVLVATEDMDEAIGRYKQYMRGNILKRSK
jgi:type IV pilus assembly protein PilB